MNNEIIKVNYDTEQPTVSARELHKSLEVKYDFTRWVNSNFSEFTENTDYFRGHIDVRGNQYGGTQTIEDYILTVDMAKHICLMSRTEKGKQCRQYLIELEKAWNTPEQVMARALQIADKQIDKLKSQNTVLLEDVERMKPKEIFADSVTASKDSILVRELSKIIKQNGVEIGEKRLYEWFRANGYICKGTTEPTQKAMNLGLFERIVRTINRGGDVPPIAKVTTKVTGKGQQYFINKFIS